MNSENRHMETRTGHEDCKYVSHQAHLLGSDFCASSKQTCRTAQTVYGKPVYYVCEFIP